MHNILTDPLIRYKKDDNSTLEESLPEVYAELMKDKVASFPALRPHQRHAWHAFLVQLGAIAMHRAGITEPPDDADEWRRIIRALTPDYPDDEPWQLVVDGITLPAFMQPPASSENKIADYKPKDDMATPDELDLLVTSKAHDLKPSVAVDGELDDWLFALVTLQTMEGYMGVGHHGISRMNGGASSRTAFGITPSTRIGIHIHRDITALLNRREYILDEFQTIDNGRTLLWTYIWDGNASEAMNFSDLDPFYIEICRRIRLAAHSDDRIYARWAPSQTTNGTRIQAKALKGITGDPWTLINKKRSVALTPIPGEFSYRRMVDFMSAEDWQVPILFEPTADESGARLPMQLVARTIIRSQGKTQGYSERIVPLKSKTVVAFGRRQGLEELGEIARARIEQVGKVQQFLRHAISVFLAGGSNEAGNPLARHWSDRLNERIDQSFFDDLQNEFELNDAEDRRRLRNDWCLRVIEDAREVMGQAMDTLPCPAIRRYRARVRAESIFEGRIRGNNGFPELYTSEENNDDNGDNN